MPTQWVIYSGPALHSEHVQPIKMGLDDEAVGALEASDTDAWRVLLAILVKVSEIRDGTAD